MGEASCMPVAKRASGAFNDSNTMLQARQHSGMPDKATRSRLREKEKSNK
jgi:hypothetical protein